MGLDGDPNMRNNYHLDPAYDDIRPAKRYCNNYTALSYEQNKLLEICGNVEFQWTLCPSKKYNVLISKKSLF